MYNLAIMGCAATVYGLYKLLGHMLSEEDQATGSSESDPSHRSPSRDNSDRNPRHENNDPLCQSDLGQIRYYDYYPNLPTSSSTTKRHSDVPLQSESSSKYMEEIEQYLERLERLKNSRKPKPSVPKDTSASSKPFHSPTEPPRSSAKPKPSVPKDTSTSSKSFHSPTEPPRSSAKPEPSVPKDTSASSKPFHSPTEPPLSSAKPKPSVPDDTTSASSKPFHSPTEPPRSSAKPTPSSPRTNPTNQKTKINHTVVQKDTSSIYKIPKDIERMIKKDIVPDVLKKPLSPYTYKDYFAALLYAEDFYIEKWSDFQLLDVTLELHDAAIYDKSPKNKNLKKSNKKDAKTFVVFEIGSVPERRPFLLSRDFVHARRSGSIAKEFQGILSHVVKSNQVLVEFEEIFYSQHHPNNRYDISFSFNRVCLKRAHEAIAAASNPLFQNYLFPDCATRKRIPSSSPQLYSNYKHNSDISSAVRRILSFEGQPPYLIEGPLCVSKATKFISNELVTLSKTGIVVQEAVVQICQCSPNSRILICSPLNKTCDVLMENLMEDIPESDMFRANAAFREVDEVPDDILQASLLEGECFSCPSLQELRQYRVIFSTFVSSFRLHNEGISAGHFSHIFLVDASSAIEPETMIALSNFANDNTTVIVTGAPHNCSGWVRSDIARKMGLKISYFERLCQTKTYRSCDPMFFTRLREESDSFQSFSYIHLPD